MVSGGVILKAISAKLQLASYNRPPPGVLGWSRDQESRRSDPKPDPFYAPLLRSTRDYPSNPSDPNSTSRIDFGADCLGRTYQTLAVIVDRISARPSGGVTAHVQRFCAHYRQRPHSGMPSAGRNCRFPAQSFAIAVPYPPDTPLLEPDDCGHVLLAHISGDVELFRSLQAAGCA